MLTKEQNERLTSVEGEAPMARLLREGYWLPFSRIEGLAAGAPPVRVRLLGGDYVAFRGEDGRIGFIDERCPHRGVSMALARLEGCALRCIFHGWLVDGSGKVVEVPTEGDRSATVAERVPFNHYPVAEHCGDWINPVSAATVADARDAHHLLHFNPPMSATTIARAGAMGSRRLSSAQ